MKKPLFICTVIILLLTVINICLAPSVTAKHPGWERQKVDLKMTGKNQIKAVYYPPEKPVLLKRESQKIKSAVRKKLISKHTSIPTEGVAEETITVSFANVIDSPPLDGFVPQIAVLITDKRYSSSEGILEAVPSSAVQGDYPTPVDPQTDYAIGIFDTGASAHIMGNAAAVTAGLFYPNTSNDLITSNTVEIMGVTGSVSAWVSKPLGLYIDGLGAIDSGGLLTDTSGMVGEWNVAIAVGQGGTPDLPTVVGSPLSVYFATSIKNSEEISVIKDGNDIKSPDLLFYELDDPGIPDYSNIIHMQLRPLGGVNVQYIIDPFSLDFDPYSPSIIVGNLSQSLFFIRGVDMYDGSRVSTDDNAFMFDTGAQVTVICSRIAMDHLGLNPDNPEFEVEIQGVTGGTIMAPGFYIDTIEIPAFPEWLGYTNVPIIVLDVDSPEGGELDGIIGTNLFNSMNLLLKGGGLLGMDVPTLEFEFINMIQDLAPEEGDGIIDELDLAELVNHWLETPDSPSWNPKCDMSYNSRIDLSDFAILAQYWFKQI